MQDDDDQRGLVGWIIGAAVAGVIGLALALSLLAANGGLGGATATSADSGSGAASGASAGVGASGSSSAASTTGAAPAAGAASGASTSSAGAASAAATGTSGARDTVGLPYRTKLYFDSGVSALPVEGADALRPAIAAARKHPSAQVIISGYHDKTGSIEQNEELAKARAKSVLNALVAGGIGEGRVELRKPQLTEGGADDREARRVEVSVE